MHQRLAAAAPTAHAPAALTAVRRRAAAPSVLFLGLMYAGNSTRFLNLRAHTQSDPRIRPRYRDVHGWIEGGVVERLPLLPNAVKGRARAICQASALAAAPRPDAIWSAVTEALTPHLWSQTGPLRRPMVIDLDCTFDQLEEMAPAYFNRPPRTGVRRALARLQERIVWRHTALFTPWSRWAADGLRHAGVDDRRIRILPPGIDLDQWRPRPEPRAGGSDLPRLLFVGADFNRKGGPALLSVIRHRFAGRCELDIVTRTPLEESPGIRVHRAEPNSPLLRGLYARADLFVLPTRAECFGIAAVEAMASGLPVIMADTGGARDIVAHGESGWLIPPGEQALAEALEQALAGRDRLAAIGRNGRRIAEARFDGRRNDATIVDLILDLVEAGRARTARRRSGAAGAHAGDGREASPAGEAAPAP
ncbi:MAG: glycosyltransferase family 4 protein [Dehalococcoidia bacterium]